MRPSACQSNQENRTSALAPIDPLHVVCNTILLTVSTRNTGEQTEEIPTPTPVTIRPMYSSAILLALPIHIAEPMMMSTQLSLPAITRPKRSEQA